MTWSKFQQDAYALTEREIRKLEKTIIASYEQAEREIKAQIKDLYAEVLAGVNPDDYYNTVIKADRLDNLLRNVQRELVKYNRIANTNIKQASALGISNTYYRKMYASGWLVPEVAVGVLPPALVEMVVYGTEESWKAIQAQAFEKIYGSKGFYMPARGSLTDLLTRRKTELINGVRDAISNGLIHGQTNRQMTAVIADIIGQVTPEGTSGAIAKALRIVRTETTRTMNAGGYAQAMYLKSQGVQVQRIWDATLDIRIRADHGRLDSQIHEVDEPFCIGTDCAFYPGAFALVKNNANCRCRVSDTLNNESPQLRRGKVKVWNPETEEYEWKSEVFSYKRFDEWAKENNLTANKYGVMVVKK